MSELTLLLIKTVLSCGVTCFKKLPRASFANLYLKDMSEQQLVCYQNLLQEEDADLWDWLHEIKQPPVIYLKIITDIKGCVTKWL